MTGDTRLLIESLDKLARELKEFSEETREGPLRTWLERASKVPKIAGDHILHLSRELETMGRHQDEERDHTHN